MLIKLQTERQLIGFTKSDCESLVNSTIGKGSIDVAKKYYNILTEAIVTHLHDSEVTLKYVVHVKGE